MLTGFIKAFLSKAIDKKLRLNTKNYIWQSILVFFCMSAILLLHKLFGGIIVASLGASSFILFVTPHTDTSAARYVIGGYVCGAVTGVLFGLLRSAVSGMDFAGRDTVCLLICAAAAAVTTFLMVAANFEHPPAAALALGLSAEPSCLPAAAAAIMGIMILCAVRYILRKYLKNLI